MNGNKNTKPWFNDNIKQLVLQKRNAYLKYRSIKTVEEYHSYTIVRNNANAQITDIKKNYREVFSKD